MLSAISQLVRPASPGTAVRRVLDRVRPGSTETTAPKRSYRGRRARAQQRTPMSRDTVRLWLATLRHDIGCRGEHLSHGACHAALRLGRMRGAPPEALAELQSAATDGQRPHCVREAAGEAAAQLLLNTWLSEADAPTA